LIEDVLLVVEPVVVLVLAALDLLIKLQAPKLAVNRTSGTISFTFRKIVFLLVFMIGLFLFLL